MSTESLGSKLRRLRLERNLPLRKVAAMLDIDVAILSKMERGKRTLTKKTVLQLATIYKCEPDDLIVDYLSEKVYRTLEDEKLALKALQVAEGQLVYANKAKPLDKDGIARLFNEIFKKDSRIKAAFLFGSFARGEANADSDIDIIIRFNKDRPITLFDLADITEILESATNRKVDIVEEGYIKPFAMKTAEKDLIQIYG